ncbi:hypothetical protein [Paucibacter sp. Y2R2-4]|uniref:hypothetical protein n=1 Tax=Paucibacter sp. Y2R2-4 TaxID=2893553 RepID=UPI0021E47854|nr:hypothetical protein [Paucibacter sp. Y2R2-4]MCV2351556.1 hypothetical protein [Paucibacter sp. Y2R2-4]
MKFHQIVFALSVLGLVSACSNIRLQTPSEALNEMSKTNQRQAELQCDQDGGQDRVNCQRKIREAYEAQRKKNSELIR